MAEDIFEEIEEPLLENEDALEESESPGLTVKDFESLVISPSDWTVETLVSQIGKQIELDPAFQRRNVWNYDSKSRFIESLFLGIPIPQILLSARQGTKGGYLVLDGKQRLLTVKEFIDGKRTDGKPFRLINLRILKNLQGKSWSDISVDEDWKFRLLNETLRTALIRGWKDEQVLYEIFYRLNSGSVKLSPMELRMSLHPGEFLKYIIRWTESIGPLHRLLNKTRPDARMADVELSVRFLGFTQGEIKYRGDLKKFLDETSIKLNEEFGKSDDSVTIVTARLAEMNLAIEAGIAIFGKGKFCRKYVNGLYETRFNRAIFDIQVGALAIPAVRSFALTEPAAYKSSFENLFADNDFVRSVETTTKSPQSTHTRFSMWYRCVNELTLLNIAVPPIEYEIPNSSL